MKELKLNKLNLQPKEKTELIQAKVPSELKRATKKILKSKRLTWNDLIVAAMKQLCTEADQPKE